MTRHRRSTHKRGHTPAGAYLARHQDHIALARDNYAFFHPLGPGGSLLANRLEERDPTTGEVRAHYSPGGLEFRCPSCKYIYTVNALDLIFWHSCIMQTGPLIVTCSHCPAHSPILKIYRHPENGQDWMEPYEGAR